MSGDRLGGALGPLEHAGTARALADGLGDLGHVAQGLTWDTHPLGYRADGVDAGRRARLRFARSAPREFDVLHGQGGRAWFSHLDFAWARSRDTTCVIHYDGSETWISDLAARLHPRRARIIDPSRGRSVRRHRCLGTLVAHAAVVQDLELATYLTSDYRTIYVAPFAIDLEAVERARGPNRGGPLATACASCTRRPDRFIKESAAIEEIVGSLEAELPIELESISGVARAEVLAATARADIVIDQITRRCPGCSRPRRWRSGRR